MTKLSRDSFLSYMRNFIFGAEDSLVSTVGLLAGVTVAGAGSRYVIIAGIVLIFVEALSMGVGSFLSEKSLEEYKKIADGKAYSIPGAFIMFISYLVFGLIPLSPYIFFTPDLAFPISVTATMSALFLLGFISAKILKISPIKNGVRMLILGGAAVVLGTLVGIALR